MAGSTAAERRRTIADTESRFRDEPQLAASSPAVRAALVDGRARLTAGPFAWDSDLPAVLGGQNLAPSPTAYLLGALAGCAVALIHDTLAPQLDIAVDDVVAEVACGSDARGLLGLDHAAPDLYDLRLEVTIDSPEAPERIEALRRAWVERCPIYLALLKPSEVDLRIRSTQGKSQMSS